MPKFHERFKCIPEKEAKKVLGAIEKQLNNRFDEIRSEKYNPNTKGFDYEIVLKEFFESYLNGAFDFLDRVGILDVDFKVKSVLKPSQNEFDVVAIYRNAVPKLVYRNLVPYDSVAFITEVKQTLKLSYLKADLQKFSKLEELKVDRHRLRLLPRIVSANGRNRFLERPLRLLFYYEAEADAEKVNQLLCGNFRTLWDIFVILKEDVVMLNSTLPLVQEFQKGAQYIRDIKYPLLKAMFYTCMSVEGTFIDSWLIFWNLFRAISQRDNVSGTAK